MFTIHEVLGSNLEGISTGPFVTNPWFLPLWVNAYAWLSYSALAHGFYSYSTSLTVLLLQYYSYSTSACARRRSIKTDDSVPKVNIDSAYQLEHPPNKSPTCYTITCSSWGTSEAIQFQFCFDIWISARKKLGNMECRSCFRTPTSCLHTSVTAFFYPLTHKRNSR